MAGFAMCPDCAREYADPSDRRFHAQPVACPVCGPQVWLEMPGNTAAQREPRGFRRCCDSRGQAPPDSGCASWQSRDSEAFTWRAMPPTLQSSWSCVDANCESISLLQSWSRTSEVAGKQCRISTAELALLESTARPIVLLRRRSGASIAREAAPGQDWLGVMLPYTPLHHLLLERRRELPPCARHDQRQPERGTHCCGER